MRTIEEEKFICIDCEFTGLDPHQDRIIEVAAAVFDAKTIYSQFESLIDPEYPISESSMAIHHITQEMVKDKPKIHEVLPKLLQMIGKHTIIGHGIGFDIEFIHNSAQRSQIPCDIKTNPSLDTLRMARLYGESPINSLEKLRQHFHIEEEGAHRAMNDVLVNMEVFRQLIKQYKTTQQLFEALAKPIYMKTMPLGKHKGRLLKEIPLQYLLWAVNKDFDQDLLFSLRSEIKRRKQGDRFEQSSSPFANL